MTLLDEGHTGVALFMTLSGYLFAKLLDGKSISYPAFFWNRLIRLAPLLLVTFALVAIERYLHHKDVLDFLRYLYRGLVYPTWPNGGWSITTELHFYALLPALLFLARHSKAWLMAVVAAALAVRCLLYIRVGEIQSLAYWTIVGRIDQFTLGIAGFLFARQLASRTLLRERPATPP